MAKKQGVHAGPNGPRFVFGRENLDYRPDNLAGAITADMGNPSDDFYEKKTGEDFSDVDYDPSDPHGQRFLDAGDIDRFEKHQEMQSKDMSNLSGFVHYAISDLGIGLDELKDMDEKDTEGAVMEYILDGGFQGQDEASVNRMLKKAQDGGFYESAVFKFYDDIGPAPYGIRPADEVANMAHPEAMYKTRTFGDFNEGLFYVEAIENGFVGSVDELVASKDYQQDFEDRRAKEREAISDMVDEWGERITGKRHPSARVKVVNKDDGFTDEMAFKDFVRNPLSSMKPADERFIQEWVQTKDNTLDVKQMDSEGHVSSFEVSFVE